MTRPVNVSSPTIPLAQKASLRLKNTHMEGVQYAPVNVQPSPTVQGALTVLKRTLAHVKNMRMSPAPITPPSKVWDRAGEAKTHGVHQVQLDLLMAAHVWRKRIVSVCQEQRFLIMAAYAPGLAVHFVRTTASTLKSVN